MVKKRNMKLIDAIVNSEMNAGAAHEMSDIKSWIKKHVLDTHVKVSKTSISSLQGWEYNMNSIKHESGAFFKIRGLEVLKSFQGKKVWWNQPIIDQPEIGFLGFISKIINGSLHFLVQAKIEPGNLNIVQLSPTIQATRSNFTQAHKGKPTKYLEHFTKKNKHIIYDQLQSEQGARFYRKRNRNIIILEQDIENSDENFKWMTLKQIKDLMREDNLVNMDTRTVLSGILTVIPTIDLKNTSFTKSLERESFFYDACQKIVEMKFQTDLKTNFIDLKKMKGWHCDNIKIRNLENNFFEVIGVDVEIDGREVSSWSQPMIKPSHAGICVFFVKHINGILHFLCQLKIECGNLDIVEIAPSIQTLTNDTRNVPFYEFINHQSSSFYLDCFQSEEGGRFYQEENRNMIIINETIPDIVENNYVWLSLKDLSRFIKYNNMINIQARNLLSTIISSDLI